MNNCFEYFCTHETQAREKEETLVVYAAVVSHVALQRSSKELIHFNFQKFKDHLTQDEKTEPFQRSTDTIKD